MLSLCFPKKSIFGIKNIAWILTIQRRLSDEAETDLNRASTLKDFKNATEFIILLLNCAGSKKIAWGKLSAPVNYSFGVTELLAAVKSTRRELSSQLNVRDVLIYACVIFFSRKRNILIYALANVCQREHHCTFLIYKL